MWLQLLHQPLDMFHTIAEKPLFARLEPVRSGR
jgi:hypothetical protein